MQFSMTLVLASAVLSIAAPTTLNERLKQCSKVECSTNIDCYAEGCFDCNEATGTCSPSLDARQGVPLQCPGITCLSAEFGPGGDETCAAYGCGVCGPQGKCVRESELEARQGAPLQCKDMTCIAASFGPGGDESCASGGCGVCSSQDKGQAKVETTLSARQGASFQCYAVTCLAEFFGPGGDEQCAASGCGKCSAQGKCQDA